ncbi:hypothetical protein E2562_012508 [Oryza meyeriana var. granulata]|uniref:Uncharacterized protein n=1 Tax=Oryza meyeriana var. granulata TaxID=110450 RepID=A0A6G1BWH8_9ORYZ|nr:hypothetical protein E2562_012508 [Oryza meyeriana var. granulata]
MSHIVGIEGAHLGGKEMQKGICDVHGFLAYGHDDIELALGHSNCGAMELTLDHMCTMNSISAMATAWTSTATWESGFSVSPAK